MRLLVAQLRLRSETRKSPAITSEELEVLTTEPAAARTVDNGDASTVQHPPSKLRRILRSLTPRVHPWRVAIVSLAFVDVLIFGLWGRSRLLGPTAAMGEVPPDVPATIAVFAFDGRATALTGELSRATAELLTASLDGGTGLTAVTVPSETQPSSRNVSSDSTVVDASSAARIAERLGARLFVIGRIVEVGGRLRVTATMHDRNRVDPPLARASADGSARMFEVVDHVGGAARRPIPGTRGVREVAARRRDRCQPRRPIRGRAAHGQRRFSAAMDALRDAVRLDSGFALAYYRIATRPS
jgi:hypothetical protein